MTYPPSLCDEGEHPVVSMRARPPAPTAPQQLHRLGGGDRADDGT